MKKLLFLLAIASSPCVGAACCLTDADNAVIMPSESLKLAKDSKTLEFTGTVEKHLTRDSYQFIDRAGRVLAEVDGDVWRAQRMTQKDGVLILS